MLIIVYVLLILSLILQVVAISTSEWSLLSGTNNAVKFEQTTGLWSSCMVATEQYTAESIKQCTDIENTPTYLKTTQALSVLALISGIVLLIFLMFSGQVEYPSIKLIAMIFINIASIGAIVSYAARAFEVKSNIDHINPGYSFYVYIASALVSLIATIAFYIIQRQPNTII